MHRTTGILRVLGLVGALALSSCGDGGGGDCESGSTTTTEEGLVVEEVECGDGEEAVMSSQAVVHYTGTLEDGSTFDSSQGGAPFPFRVGAGDVIQGWDLGIEGMRVGGKRRLTIPPDLAYGDAGRAPVIPPGATLIFDVELVEVSG